MNPQRATLDSKGVIGQQVPFGACYSTPTTSVPCPPSMLLGLLLVVMASDLHKAMLSPHSKEMFPASPFAMIMTEKGDKEGQVCHWPRVIPSAPYNN